MKIKVDRDEFKKALNTVTKAVQVRTSSSLDGVFIECFDESLSLYATNKEIQISTIIFADVLREGSCLINANILNNIIGAFNSGIVEMDIDENNNVNLTCQKSEYKITAMDKRTYPKKEIYNANDFIKIKNNTLKSMIKETTFASADNDNVSPILRGVLIENNEDNIKFVAIDGFRMAIRREISSERYMENLKCIVPSSTLNELNKIIANYDEDVFINITDKKFIANIGKTQLVSSLITGQFIDYEKLIPDDSKTIIKINKNEILNSCERTSVISENSGRSLIKFNFSENLLTLNSKSDSGFAQDEIPINLNGEELVISFNSRYFIDALRAISDEKVIFEFNGPNNPCLIKPVDSNKYLYIVMPIRNGD